MTHTRRPGARRRGSPIARHVVLLVFALIVVITALGASQWVSAGGPGRVAQAPLSRLVRVVVRAADSAHAASPSHDRSQALGRRQTFDRARSAPSASTDTRLMLTQGQWASDQRSPTLDQMFPPDGFAMRHPILVWLFVLEALGILAFPFTFLLLAHLVDRGFVIAKTLGLLFVGYIVWIAVSLNLATYDRGLIVVAIVAFALASGLVTLALRREIVAAIRTSWRSMAIGELVFLVGFAIFILLRMWYPDLGHQFSPVSPTNVGSGRMGEKQMELAFLNAIVRSRVFPPFDPFFAHGYINYYYYGFFLVGTLCKLTQIVPATGFNLAIATFFAMLVGNVASVVLSLTRRVTPAVLGAVLVGLVGNLNGGWQLLRGLMAIATVHSSAPILGGALDIASGLKQVIFAHQALPAFDYWESTRIVPGGDISEFPYFTYLFADLHPHLIAFPMTVAALALAVSLLLGTHAGRWRIAVSVVVGAVLLGAIGVTNPWDYPTYLVVVGLGALLGWYVAHRRLELRTVLRPILFLAALTALSVTMYLPFKLNYQTVFQTGIGLVRDVTPQMLQSTGACPQGVSACPQQVRDILETPLRIYLEHFGLFLFLIVSYLALLLIQDRDLVQRMRRWKTRLHFGLYYRDRLPRILRSARIVRRMTGPEPPVLDGSLVLGGLVLVVGLVVLQYYLLAFLAGLLFVLAVVLSRAGRRLPSEELFVLMLLAVPIALSLGTQIVYVKDFLNSTVPFRMNTIFKFYNQSWVLYAVASAAALYYFMAREIPPAPEQSETATGPEPVIAPQLEHNFALEESPLPIRSDPQPAFASVPGRFETVHPEIFPNQLGVSGGRSTVTSSLDDAGAALPDVPAGTRERSRWDASPLTRPLALIDRRPLWAMCLVLLLAGSLIYTYAGTVSRETYRTTWLPENSVPFTLDGMAFMKVAYPSDYAGINWLNRHVAGAQVLAEADTGPGGSVYDWRSRVSMFTGLPTIINGIHEGEQRYADEMGSRSTDLHLLYNSTNQSDAWRIIRTYDVRYIYVGFSERLDYSHAGLAKFRSMVGHGLVVGFQAPGVTIYEVTQA